MENKLKSKISNSQTADIMKTLISKPEKSIRTKLFKKRYINLIYQYKIEKLLPDLKFLHN